MAAFFIKQHDKKAIQTQLKDETGQPLNLTGYTSVTFNMRIDGMALKVPSTGIAGSGAATVLDAVNGKVQYRFLAADSDTAGVYKAEWQVVYSDGTQDTSPTPDYDTVTITADLDGA